MVQVLLVKCHVSDVCIVSLGEHFAAFADASVALALSAHTQWVHVSVQLFTHASVAKLGLGTPSEYMAVAGILAMHLMITGTG